MYKELLEKFDLIIGEVFTYKGSEYLVGNDGIFKKIPTLTDEYELDKELMVDMIIGKIKRVKQWKPKYEERYCVPNIRTNVLYDNFIWTGDNIDKRFLERGLVCKTEEEAASLANKMLEELQND